MILGDISPSFMTGFWAHLVVFQQFSSHIYGLGGVWDLRFAEIILDAPHFSSWLIGGLGPSGLDSWDPLMKGIGVLRDTPVRIPVQYSKENNRKHKRNKQFVSLEYGFK